MTGTYISCVAFAANKVTLPGERFRLVLATLILLIK